MALLDLSIAALLTLDSGHRYQRYWDDDIYTYGGNDYAKLGFDYAGGVLSRRDTGLRGALIFPAEFQSVLDANDWFEGVLIQIRLLIFTPTDPTLIGTPIDLFWQVESGVSKGDVCALDLASPGMGVRAQFPGRSLTQSLVGRLPLSGVVQG
jgi:hypothetical protein